ncbi:MAG TPA: helix-turn-helix domain-containing protein [Candidatus Saccharimonadales bacterium]|nr:helix-turn-helix domain-containing protein [Candidatus Saccharimonadales bacterium]
MDISAALQKLGLNTTESAIYLYLTQAGVSFAPQIQTALALDKVPTYRALKELKNQGFIEALGETRNQRFIALPLAKLLSRYDEQVSELREARSGLEAFMTRLTDQQSELYKQNNVTIYEGKAGYRLWNEQRLGKGVTTIREGGSDAFILDFFSKAEVGDYMRDFIKRRVAKGINIKILHNAQEPLIDWDRSDPAILKETRSLTMPDGLQAYMSIFGNKFGFYTLQAGRYLGVIIDDPMTAQMMTWFFDGMWESGKKV